MSLNNGFYSRFNIAEKYDSESTRLTLEHLAMAFLFLAAMMGAALVAFVWEILRDKERKEEITEVKPSFVVLNS